MAAALHEGAPLDQPLRASASFEDRVEEASDTVSSHGDYKF